MYVVVSCTLYVYMYEHARVYAQLHIYVSIKVDILSASTLETYCRPNISENSTCKSTRSRHCCRFLFTGCTAENCQQSFNFRCEPRIFIRGRWKSRRGRERGSFYSGLDPSDFEPCSTTYEDLFRAGVYWCEYVRIHAHTHIHLYRHQHMWGFVCVFVWVWVGLGLGLCMHVYLCCVVSVCHVHIFIHKYTYIHTKQKFVPKRAQYMPIFVYIHIYIHMCVYKYVYICAHMVCHIFMCIHIYI